jgi:hypothetical protein
MTMQTRSAPVLFYASQSGRPTLDQGEGGGNPFASALVELLARPALTLSSLRAELVHLTRARSRGLQEPEVSSASPPGEWCVRPVPAGETRVALVCVYADYQGAGATSLPGARRDLDRVGRALEDAGFAVTTAIDPPAADLTALLREFRTRSRAAAAAVVYVTGHGFEHDGRVYLVPRDCPLAEDAGRLADLAIGVADLADHAQAASANLVFYGGCRTPW